jgi:hypothetical protein
MNFIYRLALLYFLYLYFYFNEGINCLFSRVVEIHTKNCENHTKNGEKHTIKKSTLPYPDEIDENMCG